jgi:hypothetical protein
MMAQCFRHQRFISIFAADYAARGKAEGGSFCAVVQCFV